MTDSLELRGIRKAYGGFVAVDRISLTVPPGSIFGMLGPNGAGKTTTIRMIMDIIAPDEGDVLLFGRPRRRKDLHRIGYLPEERGLYAKMTVIDHLVFLGELHGLTRGDARQRGLGWLDRLDLGDRADAKVEELSKGMQQKIQLAGTLLHEPEIVILDEPFSGLDPINQGRFKEILGGFKNEGRTLLFSTHVMEQAEKLCDHICLISNGRIVLTGELAAIRRDHGGNGIRVVGRGDLARLGSLPQVESLVGDPGEGSVKLFLRDGASSAELLRQAVGFLDVDELYSEEPDLEEIFIKVVQDAA